MMGSLTQIVAPIQSHVLQFVKAGTDMILLQIHAKNALSHALNVKIQEISAQAVFYKK